MDSMYRYIYIVLIYLVIKKHFYQIHVYVLQSCVFISHPYVLQVV